MAEGVGRQLAERDREHADRVKSLEIMMKEKVIDVPAWLRNH